MKPYISIEIERLGYSPYQVVDRTMTVGDLMSILEDYDPETPIIISNDKGYTYSPIEERNITDGDLVEEED